MNTTFNFGKLSEEALCANGAAEPSTDSGWNVQMPWANKAFVDLTGDAALTAIPNRIIIVVKVHSLEDFSIINF